MAMPTSVTPAPWIGRQLIGRQLIGRQSMVGWLIDTRLVDSQVIRGQVIGRRVICVWIEVRAGPADGRAVESWKGIVPGHDPEHFLTLISC